MQPNPTHSLTKRMYSATVLVALATLCVKVIAMGKEMLLASYFGTSDQIDAFVLALSIPAYIINVLGGSLNVALVPTYIETLEKEGPCAAGRLLSQTLTLNLILLAIISIFLALGSGVILPLLGLNFSPDKLQLCSGLFLLLLPTIAISGLSVTLSAILNAHDKFFAVSLAPALIPLTLMTSVLVLGADFGGYVLAFGTLLGFFIELVYITYFLRKSKLQFCFSWNKTHANFRKVLKQYIPAISGSSLMCSAVVIDQIMSANLTPGSLAALSYGTKIVAVTIGIVTMALGTAALPYFSKMVALENWGQIRATLKLAIAGILLFTIPLTLLIVFGSEQLVRLVFEHGKFTQTDTALVGKVQAVLALQIPFHTLGILFVRMVSALKLNYLMLLSNIISVIVNIALNFLLMRTWGIVGIAMSTVIVYVVASAFLGISVYRAMPKNH